MWAKSETFPQPLRGGRQARAEKVTSKLRTRGKKERGGEGETPRGEGTARAKAPVGESWGGGPAGPAGRVGTVCEQHRPGQVRALDLVVLDVVLSARGSHRRS